MAYKAAPSDATTFRGNKQGRIVYAVSATTRMHGKAGPFNDLGIIMKPGKESGA